MSFVVEEVPLRKIIVFPRPIPIIRVGKGFDASAEERMVFPNFNGSLPNDFADVAGLADEKWGVRSGK